MSTIKIKFKAQGKAIDVLAINTNQNKEYKIGSGKSQTPVDITLPFPSISRNHANIAVKNGVISIIDQNSTNGTYLNKNRLEPNREYPLRERDLLEFSLHSNIIGEVHVESFDSPSENGGQKNILELLATKPVVSIGRDSASDIYLTSSNVSRRHAQVERKDGKIVITDLNSKNGTYVNGTRISSPHEIKGGDIILIGSNKLTLNEEAKDIRNETAIKLINVQKVFPGNKVGLQAINLSIKAKSLVGIMGPSGCGKSTLLKAITGDNPHTHGQILIHGLDLLENYEYIKTYIGYVPQDDIIHVELTVQQCLYYAAKLRIENANDEFVNKQIEKVLSQLNILETRYQRVSSLSGGQRKRVSIAVELLNDPYILFLDEPTSPLDPQSVEEFLTILKQLADNGTTVVLVTHKPEDLAFLDEVLFLGKGGYPLFFDKVSKHLSYFGVEKTVSVYPKLSDVKNPQFQQYYRQFTSNLPLVESPTANSETISSKKSFGFFRQLYWLTKRYLNIKTNDVTNTAILLLQAPVIAVLIILIFNQINVGMLFLMAISAIWFGTNNAAREIVIESPIYKRERMYNLNILTYLLSKILVLVLFALIQTVIFTSILYFYYKGKQVAVGNYMNLSLWFASLSLVSILFGLFLSASAKTNDQVVSIIPIALIPQIMLAGVLAKISSWPVEILSYLTISRWGTEGFSNIQKKVIVDVQALNEKGVAVIKPTVTKTKEFIIDQFHKSYADKSIFGEWTATLKLDMVALSTIALIFFLLTVYFLKKKDSI